MFRNDLILPIVFQFNCNSHPYFSASHEQASQHQLLCYQQTSRSFRVSSKHLKWKHCWKILYTDFWLRGSSTSSECLTILYKKTLLNLKRILSLVDFSSTDSTFDISKLQMNTNSQRAFWPKA